MKAKYGADIEANSVNLIHPCYLYCAINNTRECN